MAHKKVHLPEKVCPQCQRPFSWRKKWERCWDEVVYCSERCRREKKANQKKANMKKVSKRRQDA